MVGAITRGSVVQRSRARLAPQPVFGRRPLRAAFALALAVWVSAPLLDASPSQRGRRLFVGEEPLRAKIRKHAGSLPPEVVVCSNCHAARDQVQPKASSAPRLDRALLLQAISRRGGPPSAYSERSFCKLLRTGVDPAHVLISREMPAYDAADAQCLSLWQFLTLEKR